MKAMLTLTAAIAAILICWQIRKESTSQGPPLNYPDHNTCDLRCMRGQDCNGEHLEPDGRHCWSMDLSPEESDFL